MDGTSEAATNQQTAISVDLDAEAASLAASEVLARKLEQEFQDEQLARGLQRAMEEEDRAEEQSNNTGQGNADIVTPVMSLKELRHEFYLSSDDEDDDFNDTEVKERQQEDSKPPAVVTKTFCAQDSSGQQDLSDHDAMPTCAQPLPKQANCSQAAQVPTSFESDDNDIAGQSCGSPSAADDEHLARLILQNDMDEAAAASEALAISLSMDLQSKSAASSSQEACMDSKMPAVANTLRAANSSGLHEQETKTPPLPQQQFSAAPSHSQVAVAACTSPLEYGVIVKDSVGGGGDQTTHSATAVKDDELLARPLQENNLDQAAEASEALAKTLSKEPQGDFTASSLAQEHQWQDSKMPAIRTHRQSQNKLLDQAALMRMFNMESQSHFAASSSMPQGMVGAKKKPPPQPPLGLSKVIIPSPVIAPTAAMSLLDSGGGGTDDDNVDGGGGGVDESPADGSIPAVVDESIDSILPVEDEDDDEILAFRLHQDELDQAVVAVESEALAQKQKTALQNLVDEFFNQNK